MAGSDDDEVGTPHDTLFHHAFSDPAVARLEVEAVLPAEVCAQLDLGQLRPVPSRTVSPRLKNLVTDLMFEAPMRSGEAAFLWLLFEHQSQAEWLMAFRVLRYQVHRWSVYLRSAAGKARGRLPLIIPVVILHDREGGRPPARLSALYDATPEQLALLRPLLPESTFLLDDLMAQSEEALARRSTSAVYTLTLWLLRARGEAPPERLEAYRAQFARLAADGNQETAEAMMRYVLKTSREANPVALQAARAASPALTEGVMGIWHQRIEEGVARGREEGREEGVVQGREEVLLEQLSARFGALPGDLEARVHGADVETIRRWAVRILSAQTLDEVFEDG